MKKLTNEIIDVKRNIGEVSSNHKPYRNFFRRLAQNKPLELPHPPANLNIKLDDITHDNFCTYHQANHIDKTCPQWVNAMNLVDKKFLDECTKTEEQVENLEVVEEENPFLPEVETTLVLWDMLPIMNMFEEESEEKDVKTQNNYNIISKGPHNFQVSPLPQS